MKAKILLCSTALLFLVSACNKESVKLPTGEELMTYFNEFESEALERGLEIDLEMMGITGYFENFDDDSVLGQCRTYSDGSKEVAFDSNYWHNCNEIDRMYLVFHELGHCALDRDHTEEKDSNGRCTSIMQSGENECRKNFTENNKEELFDELFENL